MKIRRFLITFTTLSFCATGISCDWYIFNPSKWSSKYMENPPEICTKVLKGDAGIFSQEGEQILAQLPVDDLITLQRCGLAFHPHHQFQFEIANHNEYPVPALVRRLQSDDDEYFQYYLILTFHALTTSKKHSDRFKTDKVLVTSTIGDAISRMRDRKLQDLSESEFLSIKGFLDQ